MGTKQERVTEGTTATANQPADEGRAGALLVWRVLGVLVLVIVVGTASARLAYGARYEGMLILAAAAAATLLGLRMLVRDAAPEVEVLPVDEPLKDVLDSAGPMVMAAGLDGRLTYINPAAERLLGYHAEELMNMSNAGEILASGEGLRLVQEMMSLGGSAKSTDRTAVGRLAAYMKSVGNLPPSKVPSFHTQLRRKDGTLFPVTLHISALRDTAGALSGMVAVALDQTATFRQEQALRESQERYRDLFESSSEMIATLSPSGQFLYANPAWKRWFGKDNEALLALNSFEELFGSSCRTEVSGLFRRALDSEVVDRAPLRHHTPDGRVLDLELSLSQRQKAGNPLAVRCLLRDVTQQKQREHRLALQLVTSQIMGENTSPEAAATRILEALCESQGWDLAFKWEVNPNENRLEFCTAWGAPNMGTDAFIQESIWQTPTSGVDLPGRAWQEGRPIWITDLAAVPPSQRLDSAQRHHMVSGWAVPVRVGSMVLAVLEFYSHLLLREDREATATVETVAASLGQMLARSYERGRAEELYRQQEILLDSVADGICGVDRNGLVSFANPAAARLLGSAASSLTGKRVHDLLHGYAPATRECDADCPLRRSTANRKSAAGEDTVFRSDGGSFPAEYALTPILDQGRFSGSVLSFRDISQRFAVDRLKDEFISTVSHELRTPLTSIRGALGLLSSGILTKLDGKAADLLRIALTNSDRLVRLINDILDLERIQSGREPLAFRSVQLGDVVRQSIDDMQPVAEAAGVHLMHDTTQAEIAADGDRLLQVITNLLSNAVKFSPPGSTISVMLRPGVTGVTVSVIDQGRGIPADKLEAIFGRFQQVDASDSRQKGGTGLGLAICRTIVLQHSGRIWAERNPIVGSTFRVFLPYQPVQVQTSANVFDMEPRHGTILLADANAAARPQVAAQLSRHGYRVVETTTLEQTLAAAHEGVHAILLGTSVDGMNGWEILPILRSHEPEAHTPIALLGIDHRKDPMDSPAVTQRRSIRLPLDEDALLGELARTFCEPGEKARILVIGDDVEMTGAIREIFSRDTIEVAMAHSRQGALDACYSFKPHLLVLDISLPDGDGFNIIDWLRQRDDLSTLPLAVYSGRDLSSADLSQLALGPTHFLSKARIKPQQLEALVLTMLRTSRPLEEAIPLESHGRNS